MAAEESKPVAEREKPEIVPHVCAARSPLVLARNSFAGHEVSTPLTSGRGSSKYKKRTPSVGYVLEKLMAGQGEAATRHLDTETSQETAKPVRG